MTKTMQLQNEERNTNRNVKSKHIYRTGSSRQEQILVKCKKVKTRIYPRRRANIRRRLSDGGHMSPVGPDWVLCIHTPSVTETPIPGPIFHAPNLSCSLSLSRKPSQTSTWTQFVERWAKSPLPVSMQLQITRKCAPFTNHRSGQKLLNGEHRHLVPSSQIYSSPGRREIAWEQNKERLSAAPSEASKVRFIARSVFLRKTSSAFGHFPVLSQNHSPKSSLEFQSYF